MRTRIEDPDDIIEDDREVFLAFSDEIYLLKTQYSHHRHEELLRHCIRIAEGTTSTWVCRHDRIPTTEIMLTDLLGRVLR